MFSTSMAAAVVCLLASTSTQPTWQPDYPSAVSQSGEQRKPIAVFIAEGENGYEKLIAEGTLSTEAAKLLQKNYICLYVDSTTDNGKKLAKSFELSNGLVISDKSGNLQALRHVGKVSQTELTKQLVCWVCLVCCVKTEYSGAVAAPVVQPVPFMGGCPNGQCGGCANGQCGRR